MNITKEKHTNRPVKIDLRSDTVTLPSEGMKAAIAAAKLGDDVYGDDPSVNALQEKSATLLGKDAALFMSSGTQSNLCAMLAHCQRGEEILCGDTYHVFCDEAGGASVLGGVMFSPMPTNENGGLNPDDIDKNVKPDDAHYAISKMLSLENTNKGNTQSVEEITNLANRAHKYNLMVHLDGARLMNATVKLGVNPKDMLAEIDSVSLCLSKGLGAPAGSILAGPEKFIKRAHRIRKLLGGGMRQAGLLAAAGTYALDNNIQRLAEDHKNAIKLAEGLSLIKGINVNLEKVNTNMVYASFEQGTALKLRKHLASKNIYISAHLGDDTVRLVTHLDCREPEIDLFISELKSFLN
ncbi:MAG: threonine aldolase [Paracoccaceae bacterium]|jgi:threonine aldolase